MSDLSTLSQQYIDTTKENSVDKAFQTLKDIKESKAKVENLANEHLDRINNYNMESLQKAVQGQGGGEQITPDGKILPPTPDMQGRINTLRTANMQYDAQKSAMMIDSYRKMGLLGQPVQTQPGGDGLPPPNNGQPQMVPSIGANGKITLKGVDPNATARVGQMTRANDLREQNLQTRQMNQGIIAEGTNVGDAVNIGGKKMVLAKDAIEFQKQLGDSNSQMGRVKNSMNTLMLHAGEGVDILNQAKLAKQPPIVGLQNLASKISGNSGITDTNLARHIITNEFGRLLNGIQATDGERSAIDSALGKNPGESQVRDAYKIIAKMGRDRLKPFEQTYKDKLGKDPGNELFQADSKIAYGKVLGASKYNKTKDQYLDSNGKVIS